MVYLAFDGSFQLYSLSTSNVVSPLSLLLPSPCFPHHTSTFQVTVTDSRSAGIEISHYHKQVICLHLSNCCLHLIIKGILVYLLLLLQVESSAALRNLESDVFDSMSILSSFQLMIKVIPSIC